MGQSYYEICCELGVLPSELGDADPRDRRFVKRAHAERNRRANDEYGEARGGLDSRGFPG